MPDQIQNTSSLSVQQLTDDIAAEQYRISGYHEWLLLYPGYLSESSAQKIREALEFSEVRLRLLETALTSVGNLFLHGYEERLRIYVPYEVLNELQSRLTAMNSVAQELIEIPQGSASVSDEIRVDAK